MALIMICVILALGHILIGYVVNPEPYLEVVGTARTVVLDDELYCHIVALGSVDDNGLGSHIGDRRYTLEALADGIVVEIVVAIALGHGRDGHRAHGGAELLVEGIVEEVASVERSALQLDDVDILGDMGVAHRVGQCGVGDWCHAHVAYADGDFYGVAGDDIIARIEEVDSRYVAAKRCEIEDLGQCVVVTVDVVCRKVGETGNREGVGAVGTDHKRVKVGDGICFVRR